MKLEPELIKDILIWCEENLPREDNLISQASDIKIDNFSTYQIVFHAKLLELHPI